MISEYRATKTPEMSAGPANTDLPVTNLRRQSRRGTLLRRPSPHPRRVPEI